MNDRPIIIFGGRGHIGYELSELLRKFISVLMPSRTDLNLKNFEDVEAYLKVSRPGLIINAASFSDIDLAESSIQEAQRINSDLPALLASEALERKINFIQFSTDLVFDGRGQRKPYEEDDLPNPLNVFGRSMLRGESAVKSINPNHLIFRTSRTYSLRRPCFLKKLINTLKNHGDINVVSDQHASPTWSRSVAQMVVYIIKSKNLLSNEELNNFRPGVYHIAAKGEASWYDFAEAVVEHIDRSKVQWNYEKKPILRAVDADLVPSIAKLPRYSVLSTLKTEKEFGISPTFWVEQLKECLNEF
tara:strand:+ start:60 stop:968 length:909 start_codon:yes stop_codon:yes gene_type:complete